MCIRDRHQAFVARLEGLMLYDGWFEDNGSCGYVLKPEFMRSQKIDFGQYLPQPSEWRRVLTVRIISGYLLPKQPGRDLVEPRVQVTRHRCLIYDTLRAET